MKKKLSETDFLHTQNRIEMVNNLLPFFLTFIFHSILKYNMIKKRKIP